MAVISPAQAAQSTTEPRAHKPSSGRRRAFLGSLRAHPFVYLSGLVVAIAFAWFIAPGLFATHDPYAAATGRALSGPSFGNWFGTDVIGRDLFSRVVHGTRTTLFATVLALVFAFVVGSAIGAVSGLIGGRLDALLMRAIDVLLAIPNLLIALLLITALGFGTVNIAIAVGVSSIASFSRVIRSEVLRVRTSAYVEAAYLSGGKTLTVLRRHVFPNAVGPLLSITALEFGSAVLSIASLSFLGFGTPPPAPEWGSLVAEGRGYIATSWWLTTLPGLVILVVVLAANHLSRHFTRLRGV